MTILLTGACGFVGRHYLNTMNPFSEPVVAVDTRILSTNEHLPIENRLVDLTKKDQVINLIDDVLPSSIIHLAGISIVGRDDALNTNVSMANNLFHAIVECYKDDEKPKMILAGSAAEYGELKSDDMPADEYSKLNPLEPYAESKTIISRVAHAYRRDFDIPITILRFANIYGPRQEMGKLVPNLVNAAADGKPIRLNANGAPTRQWLYIDDAVTAIDTALRQIDGHKENIFNIGNPQEISIRDLALMIIQTVQDQRLTRGDMPFPTQIEYTSKPGGPQRIAMDMSLAKRVLAFTPRVPLPIGISRTVAAYLSDKEDEIREASDSRRSFADAHDI